MSALKNENFLVSMKRAGSGAAAHPCARRFLREHALRFPDGDFRYLQTTQGTSE
jgi:hypothetical protein